MKELENGDNFDQSKRMSSAFTASTENSRQRHISIEAEDWQTLHDQYELAKQQGLSDKSGWSLSISEAAMLDFSA